MKKRAFTVMELLVVIALIVLLIALLVPSLQNSRHQAKATLCGSNIRQLVLGLMEYETENEGFPYALDTTPPEPPPGGYAGYLQYDRKGWWWFNYIVDYSKKDYDRALAIWCPSRQIKSDNLKDNVLCGNYGVNQSICKSSTGSKSRAEFIGTPLRAADIPHPSQTLLLVDAGYSMINWWHATDFPPVPLGSTIEDAAYIPGLTINRERNLWPGQEDDAIYGRHPNKTVNVGFVDGHVSREKADDLFVEKAGDTYKNIRPLWLPK
jgi:prepilin-type processing-associated H-X9-DG protein